MHGYKSVSRGHQGLLSINRAEYTFPWEVKYCECATGIQTCHWQANLARVWPDDLSRWPTTGMSTGRLPIVIITDIGEIKIRELPTVQ